jgi:hypothetical protein
MSEFVSSIDMASGHETRSGNEFQEIDSGSRLKAAEGCRSPKPRGILMTPENAAASWIAAALCRFSLAHEPA